MDNKTWKSVASPQIEYVTDHSEGVELFNHLVGDLENYIHTICEDVAKWLYKVPEEVPYFEKLTFKVEHFDGVAWKSGEPPHITVAVSSCYLMDYHHKSGDIAEEVRGILFHELTHAYQHSSGQDITSIEGVADLVRYLAGYIPLELRKIGGTYTSSYKITGFFYDWIRARYEEQFDFLYELNQSVHPHNEGKWALEEVIKSLTGETIENLWEAYQEELEEKGIECMTSQKVKIAIKDERAQDSKICLHTGENRESYFGAIAPPIMQTSLFAFENWDNFLEGITAEREHYVYTRGVNPTTEILENKLAELERGEKCKCFASGMAAISSTLFTFLRQGDHVLFLNNVYGPALSYVKALSKFGVTYTNAFIENEEEIKQHIQESTKIIYLESPSTMNFDIIDLEKVARQAKRLGILTVIDNTWATPLNQKPLIHGIDLVIHSCTKYIAGHSDTVGGAVIGSYELVDKIFEIGHQFGGGVMAPFDAWLILRGLRTLPQRLAYQQQTVKQVVKLFEKHPKIRKINHPLVFTGKTKEIYDKQATGYTTLLSVEIDFKNYEELRNFMNSFKIFKLGVSWGGFESLVTSPNYNTKANHENLEAVHQSKDLIRMYIGLEAPELILEDLKRALNTLE